jgi:para-nitrobenzyl esterase
MTVLGGREQFTSAGERMRLRWIQFATDGTGAGDWPRYLEDDRATLIIDQVDRVEADPRGERRRAWAAFLPGV